MSNTLTLTEEILQYCQTERQKELCMAVIKEGSGNAGARAIGMDLGQASKMLSSIRGRAARAGYSPEHDMTRTVPEGFHVRGTSTLYDAEGNAKLQWVKSSIDHERQREIMQEFADGLAENVPRIEPKPENHAKYDADLMPSIFIGDAHVGMRAYGKETGHHNFDTDIAVTQLREAVDYLVSKAEHSELGLIVDVGDFHHANGSNNQTFSGTPLDVDTRHRSTMYQAAMAMRYMIDRMLDKCRKVVVVVARGNHNEDVAPAMELMLSFAYENEPRVKVLETHGHYHYVEFGGNLLGICHGNRQKPEALAGSMARDMPTAWGRTNYRMWCTGHYHKEAVKSLPGCRHKIFGALPPPDGWHASHGFKGDGEMEMLTFRRDGGVQSSFVYRISQPRNEPDVRL